MTEDKLATTLDLNHHHRAGELKTKKNTSMSQIMLIFVSLILLFYVIPIRRRGVGLLEFDEVFAEGFV
jgi:hypothetical protein